MAQNKAPSRHPKLNERERVIIERYLTDMVSIPSAARRLGTTPQTIRNAIIDGRIPEAAIVWIDQSYKLLLWSKIAHLNIREYNSERKTKQK